MNENFTRDSASQDAPWDDRVNRVVIQVASYLQFDGSYSAGGRQRHTQDLVEVIRDLWKKEVVVVQKGYTDFERTCDHGIDVIALRSNVRALGDPIFSWKVRKLTRPTDGLVYASGEDAWPFFQSGAKAIQHGIWWDGPHNFTARLFQKHRAMMCTSSVKSTMCVDTNFINWLRCQGRTGLALCNKCAYIPNYVDLDRLSKSTPAKVGTPIRLIIARRYEEKRGIKLFIDALRILKQEGFPFSAHISTVGGISTIKKLLSEGNFGSEVVVCEDDMDQVLKRYGVADLAVVPTLWSEGTSLACIEALCAGLPVIATPVGGLGNLIIPGFNGELVGPSSAELARAIRDYSDPKVLRRSKDNALGMRDALGISNWRSRVLGWLRA